MLATQTEVTPFDTFRDAVEAHFKREMNPVQLFTVDVSTEDLWKTYLEAFPEGTNPIFRERTEHDCSCCRHFIRDIGNVVAVEDGKMISIWDAPDLGFPYNVVAARLSELIHAAQINSVWLYRQKYVGTRETHEDDNGNIRTWSHFHCNLAAQHVRAPIALATEIGRINTRKAVTRRTRPVARG